MARGNDERHNPNRKTGKDFLSKHGMTAANQQAAVMRASAVPASDFEGEYEPLEGFTYNPNSLLSRVMWESRMRQATGIPKLDKEEE